MGGLLYGGPGNLSDGSSLVTGHWGPKFASGDNIGMKVEVVDGATIVSFRHNEKPLGAAFSIEGWTGDKLRPVVSLGNQGQAVSIQPSSGTSFAKEAGPREGLEGDWEGEDLKVSIEAEGNAGKWRVGAIVGNSLSCEVTQDGMKFTSGPVISTRMMAPPHLQAKETAVSKLLEELNCIAREGTDLRLSSPTSSLLLTPASGPGPATKDRINWLPCKLTSDHQPPKQEITSFQSPSITNQTLHLSLCQLLLCPDHLAVCLTNLTGNNNNPHCFLLVVVQD